MPAYATQVAVRWSDMDVFGHVNNARTVTLLEEARTELLFRDGEAELGRGVVGRPRRITPAQRAFLEGYRDAERSTGDA